ncbi:MAG: hypothetical protein ACRYGG_02150 [Janthinobacterium lividum]
MSNMNATEQWAAVNGDKVVSQFEDMWSSNSLVCSECFGMSKGLCKSKSAGCQQGIADLATPSGTNTSRWDTAVAIFAQDTDISDLQCQIQTGECSSAPSCLSCDGPGAWAMLKSMETMHNTFQNIYEAIGQAGAFATDQMTQFSSTFAPIPSVKDEAIFLGILFAIVGGLIGMIPGIGVITLALASTIVAVGSGVILDTLLFNQPAPADTGSYLGTIVNTTQMSYANVVSDLFEYGSYQYTSADGKTSHTIAMSDLMADGALMKEGGDPNDFYTALVPVYERILFQQLALFTWQNLEADSVTHLPFIAFDTTPCDQVDPTNSNSVGNSILMGVNTLDSNITYNGNCYYLLDGKPGSQAIPDSGGLDGVPAMEPVCDGANALPGGTNGDMNANSQVFAQLSLSDFIVPSVKGWAGNHNQNGYPAAGSNGQLVSDPQDAGAVNIPVCDYIGNPNAPGVGCPRLDNSASSKACVPWPPSSGTNQPGDYTPGWCGVHVEQYQANEGNENPLNHYQMEVLIKDADGRPIGQATKQSVTGPLAVTDSVLPFDLIVMPGVNDSMPVQYWYSDQYWTSDSQQNQCNMGSYDSGNRNGDCGFNCPFPLAGEAPPVSATQPLPTKPSDGIGGDTTYLNTWTTAPATTAAPTGTAVKTTSAAPTPTYATGSCGLHVEQFQKNEGTENPTSNYQIEATIFDGKGNAIGTSGQVPALTGTPVVVTGLVSPLTITAGAVDSDPLTVTWAGNTWLTNGTQCSEGAWDSGNRNMDCGYQC